MPIIEVDHVTKEFQLGQLVTLKQSVVNGLNRLVGRPVEERKPFKALDDVSFSVEKGEVLGIIGHNGAGKSTLLKLLARVSKPTSGRISVIGKVAPLIEVGAGMVPDLTGRENIHLNCTILGIPKKEIARKFDQIVSFAELEEFIDTPIKRYSSGMKVKLGFAVATSVEAEILIVDEVLAVGDLAFQRKCFDRMDNMIKSRRSTVILVSHNIRQIERLSTRVLMLEHGRIIRDGSPDDVCDLFFAKSDEKIHRMITADAPLARNLRASGELEILDVALLDEKSHESDSIQYKKGFTLRLRVRLLGELNEVTFGFGIHTTDFLYLTTNNSEEQLEIRAMKPGIHEVHCRVASIPLLPGVYSLRVGVTEGAAARSVFYAENIWHFHVVADAGDIPLTARDGFFEIPGTWHVASGDSEVVRVRGKSSVAVAPQ